MNCHSVRAVLDLHAEGRLTARRGTKVSAHLEECAECRALAAPVAASTKEAGKDFKARLAAALKAQRKTATEPYGEGVSLPHAVAKGPFAPKLELWPRDLSGVALACAALAVVAVAIGWSGVPSQRELGGDDLAVWSMP